MGSIELEIEYAALFERWRKGRGSEIFASFVEIEIAHPRSFLPWFQSILLLKEAHRHTDYIYLFNAVIPQCIDLDATVLLDCSELMMKTTQGDFITSKAYIGLVDYCHRSMETLASVLQVLSSDLERWESCVSIIIQTCYTHDSELIPLFVSDVLAIGSIPMQYSLAMSITHLEVSESSETNKGHFLYFLEMYQSRFPTLPLGDMKAALFCAIMHLSLQLDEDSSKVLLQSFSDELFLMSVVPMEFSLSVFKYYHHILQSKGELAPHDWEVLSHLLQNSSYSSGRSYFPMDHLLEILYLKDPNKAMSVFLSLLRQNPNVNMKDFFGLSDEMKENKDLVGFIVVLLLVGGRSVIETNKEFISEVLDVAIDEIRKALVGIAEHDLAFLARKGVAVLWLKPKILCSFLFALLLQSSDEHVHLMIQEDFWRWAILPYPTAFKSWMEEMTITAPSSEAERVHLTLLNDYSVEFEASLEDILMLREIQPSLEQRYHKRVYDVGQQEAIFKQGREQSVFRLIATEISILFANSTLSLQGGNLESEAAPEIRPMHLEEFSMELPRTLCWEYPTIEIDLAIYMSEERV